MPDTPRSLTQPFRSPHQGRAAASVALDAGLYVAASIAIVRGPAPAKPLVSAILAFIVARLFVLGHDACHGSLFASRKANRIVGRLTLLPSYTPSSAGELGHNRIHHAFTNLKGRDYVWAPMPVVEYRHAPAWRRFLERVYRTPAGHARYLPDQPKKGR